MERGKGIYMKKNNKTQKASELFVRCLEKEGDYSLNVKALFEDVPADSARAVEEIRARTQ